MAVAKRRRVPIERGMAAWLRTWQARLRNEAAWLPTMDTALRFEEPRASVRCGLGSSSCNQVMQRV